MWCVRKLTGDTGEELSKFKFILHKTREVKIEKKIGFATTDGASNALRQIKLSAVEE